MRTIVLGVLLVVACLWFVFPPKAPTEPIQYKRGADGKLQTASEDGGAFEAHAGSPFRLTQSKVEERLSSRMSRDWDGKPLTIPVDSIDGLGTVICSVETIDENMVQWTCHVEPPAPNEQDIVAEKNSLE